MRASEVYIWSNGNVMVFDDHGNQIPKLQGTVFDLAMVKAASDRDTEFYFGRWDEGAVKMDVAWIFEKDAENVKEKLREEPES